jgi:hypothetical protein
MFAVPRDQRDALLAHATRFDHTATPDDRYPGIVDDLDAARPIADRDAFVAFLWRRTHLAVAHLHAGSEDPVTELRAWYASVDLLEQLGESLRGIFSADGAATA